MDRLQLPAVAGKKRKHKTLVEWSPPSLELQEILSDGAKESACVASRHQENDAASLSSGNASNMSASRAGRCHVCQIASRFEGIIRCMTCPRRYHRRCHANPPIAADAETYEGTWQCVRCVKKRIPKAEPPSAKVTRKLANHASLDPCTLARVAQKKFDEALWEKVAQPDAVESLEVPGSPHGAAAPSPVDSVVQSDDTCSIPKRKVKPSKTSTRTCAMCTRKIVRNPSDTNTMCLRCKSKCEESDKPVALVEDVLMEKESAPSPEDVHVENVQEASHLISQASIVPHGGVNAVVSVDATPLGLRTGANMHQDEDRDAHKGKLPIRPQKMDNAGLRSFDAAIYGIRTAENKHQDERSLNIIGRIKAEMQKIEYTERSLYDAWPEYRPDSEPGEPRELEREHRSRKDHFGRAATSQKTSQVECKDPIDKADKVRPGGGAGEESRKDGRIYHDSLDDLLGVPNCVIPMISDGQLAFREGKRNADGKLPRPKVIYKTGYNT